MNELPSPSSDLILSAATRYRPADLEIFLRSAAAHVPHADVLLVSDRRSPEFLAALRRFNPRVRLWFPPDARLRRRLWRRPRMARRLRHPRRLEAWKAALLLHSPWPNQALAVMHISVVRHFWFLHILRKGLDHGARRILLADCRDIFFQADPFPLAEPTILVGEENRRISGDSYIAHYVRRVYSPGTDLPMLDRAVICAGVVLGTRDAMLDLEREWTREFRRKAGAVHGRFVDQILLNKILYANGRVPYRALPEGGSLMTHLIFTPPDLYRLDAEGVRAPDGELVRIVHRYDRHEAMTEYAERTFRRQPAASPPGS